MCSQNKDNSLEKLVSDLKEIGFFETERKVETFFLEKDFNNNKEKEESDN